MDLVDQGEEWAEEAFQVRTWLEEEALQEVWEDWVGEAKVGQWEEGDFLCVAEEDFLSAWDLEM